MNENYSDLVIHTNIMQVAFSDCIDAVLSDISEDDYRKKITYSKETIFHLFSLVTDNKKMFSSHEKDNLYRLLEKYKKKCPEYAVLCDRIHVLLQKTSNNNMNFYKEEQRIRFGIKNRLNNEEKIKIKRCIQYDYNYLMLLLGENSDLYCVYDIEFLRAVKKFIDFDYTFLDKFLFKVKTIVLKNKEILKSELDQELQDINVEIESIIEKYERNRDILKDYLVKKIFLKLILSTNEELDSINSYANEILGNFQQFKEEIIYLLQNMKLNQSHVSNILKITAFFKSKKRIHARDEKEIASILNYFAKPKKEFYNKEYKKRTNNNFLKIDKFCLKNLINFNKDDIIFSLKRDSDLLLQVFDGKSNGLNISSLDFYYWLMSMNSVINECSCIVNEESLLAKFLAFMGNLKENCDFEEASDIQNSFIYLKYLKIHNKLERKLQKIKR